VSTDAKARLTCGILAVLALWPLVHYGVVTRYDIAPWRLNGFAMYTVPPTDVSVYFATERAGQRRPLALGPLLTPDVERALLAYRSEHRAFRTLPPDAVAQALRTEHTGLRDLVITVDTHYYDLSLGRYTERRNEYAYP
jgi:hypothetical protein